MAKNVVELFVEGAKKNGYLKDTSSKSSSSSSSNGTTTQKRYLPGKHAYVDEEITPVTTTGTVNSDGFIVNTSSVKTKPAESERGKWLETRGTTIETPELDSAEKKDTSTNYLAEFMGQSSYTGEAEDVAKDIWKQAGVSNAEEYRDKSKNDLKVFGRSVAGGTVGAIRNTANDIGYKAQASAATQEAEDAYQKYVGGNAEAKAEADKLYKEYLSSMTDAEKAELENSGALLDEGSYYYKAKSEEFAEKHKDDELKKASTMGEKYQAETREMETSDDKLVELGEGIGGMAPMVATAALTQGMSLLGAGSKAIKAVQALSNAQFFHQASGAKTEEALEKGASNDVAVSLGTASGAVELATEHIANGLGKIGEKAGFKAYGDGVVNKVINQYIDDEASRKVATTIVDVLGEGTEEFISELANYGLDKVANIEDRDFKEAVGDGLDAFVMGATISAIMQGGQAALTTAGNRVFKGEQNALSQALQTEDSRTPTAEEIKTEIKASLDTAIDQFVEQSKADGQSYTRMANQILRNPQWLAEYQAEHGELTGSNTEKVKSIASTLRNEDYVASQPTAQETVQEQTEQVVQQTPKSPQDTVYEYASDISPAKVNKILASQELKTAWEQMTGVKLEGSKNTQRETILNYQGNLVKTNEFTDALNQVKAQQAETQENATQTAQQANPSTNIPNVETAPTNDSGVSNNRSNALTEEAQELVDDYLSLQEQLKSVEDMDEIADIKQNMLNDKLLLQELGVDVSNLGVSTRNGQSEQTTNQSFQEMKDEAGQFHPINEEAQAKAQELHGRGPVQIPTTDANGNATSKTGSTLANSPITTNEGAVKLQDAYANGDFSYIPITDANASAKAEKTIRDNGWNEALASYKQAVTDGKSSKDITALGVTLYNNALNAGDTKQAIDIATLMVKNARTTAQALQANGMINKLTPEGKLYALTKSVDTITSEMQSRYGDDFTLVLDEDLVASYKEALDQGDTELSKEIYNEIMRDIGTQLPKSFGDVLTSIRYLSMLGNVRTQIRNVAGNAGFSSIRAVKNVVQIGLENAIMGKKGQGSGRTTAMLNRVADRALISECANDYENAAGQIMSGGKYQDTDTYDAIREGKQSKAFKNKAIEKSAAEGNVLAKVVNGALTGVQAYSNATNWAMDKGDIIFSKPTYACALARYCKANGYTSFSQMSEAEQAKARAVAVQEAAKATYRDSNVLSDLITEKSREAKKKAQFGNEEGKGKALYKAFNLLTEGVIPFKKTPANILMRVYEYSPVNAVASGIQTAKASSDVKKATTAEAKQTAKANLASSIEGLASGLTGSALIAMGALLARFGLINGGESDDEKQAAFDELQGKQAYSFNFPNGINITADWLAPECIPLFIGANLYQASLDDGLSFQDTIKSLKGITEPLVEMSMLSSLEEFLNTGKYVQDASATDYIISAGTSLLGQFTSSLLGQVERGLEENREETYRYNDYVSDTLSASNQRSIGQLLNKIPGVDFQQIDYVDEWGRTQDYNSTVGNLLYQTLSPGYASEEYSTKVDKELQRLYDEGYDVFPTKREQSATIQIHDADGNVTEERHLTAEEYESYLKESGSLKLSTIRQLMKTEEWKTMDDKTKAKVIDKIYEYAEDTAKSKIDKNYSSSLVENVNNASDKMKYLSTYASLSSTDYSVVDKGIEMYDSLPDEEKETLNSINTIGASAKTLSRAKSYGVDSETYITTMKDGDTDGDGKTSKVESLASSLNIEDSKEVDGMIRTIMSEDSELGETRYNLFKKYGYSAKDFVKAYTVTKDYSTKANKVSALMSIGYSSQEATRLYYFLSGTSKTLSKY